MQWNMCKFHVHAGTTTATGCAQVALLRPGSEKNCQFGGSSSTVSYAGPAMFAFNQTHGTVVGFDAVYQTHLREYLSPRYRPCVFFKDDPLILPRDVHVRLIQCRNPTSENGAEIWPRSELWWCRANI